MESVIDFFFGWDLNDKIRAILTPNFTRRRNHANITFIFSFICSLTTAAALLISWNQLCSLMASAIDCPNRNARIRAIYEWEREAQCLCERILGEIMFTQNVKNPAPFVGSCASSFRSHVFMPPLHQIGCEKDILRSILCALFLVRNFIVQSFTKVDGQNLSIWYFCFHLVCWLLFAAFDVPFATLVGSLHFSSGS